MAFIEDENNGIAENNVRRADSLNEGGLYSLRDIIHDNRNSNSENIFEIIYQGKQCEIMKYVHFKTKKGISSTH